MSDSSCPHSQTFKLRRLAKLLLEPLPLGNVSGDKRSRWCGTVPTNRGDRQGYPDRLAILVETKGLKMVNALSTAELLQDFGLSGGASARKQKCDIAADCFFGRIPVHSRGGRVPGKNSSIQVRANDRIVGAIDDLR